MEPIADAPPTLADDDAPGDFSSVSSGQMEALESELRYTRENLQATIEELETSNEELQATNEELVASNEELQSTNEELHSVNEELYTVNAEHQRKIHELTVLTDDMDNLLASTRVPTVFLDRSLRIRKFTPMAAETFGLLPHDVGRPFDSFAHRLRDSAINDELQQVLESGRPVEAEVQDHQGGWFLMRLLPYQTRQAPDGVLLTLIDIAALKQTQQELARREFELRTITDHVPALISYVDASLHYRYVNRRYCEYFGRSEADIVGCSMSELHGQPAFARIRPMLDRVLAGESVEFEHWFAPPVGRRFWAIVSYIPDTDDTTRTVRGFFVCKNVVTALKEIEQRFDRAVRGTTDGIWDWNIDTGRVFYSPRFAELLGFEPSHAEFSKADIDCRIHRDDLAAVAAAEQALLRDGTPLDVEYRLQCRDGTYRWFRGRAAAHYDAAGRVTHASGSIQDIEDYRALVQEKQRQVEQRDRFLAMLSHELRNPLGAVVNGCRVLQRRQPRAELVPVVEAIARQSQQMAALLEDLLDVARITEGKVDLQHRTLDLRDIVAPACESVQHLFEARRQVLEQRLPDGPVFVIGDPVRLQQVAANLLSNAAKYSPAEATVRIELRAVDGFAELRVIDQGDGIPADMLRRIFEPFEQLGKRVETTGGGIGLGLTVAESLVRLHGGRIEVRSEGAGLGSEFIVHLPRVEAPPTESAGCDRPRSRPASCRIALIEDNRDARETLQLLLEDDGYEVLTADNGRGGVELVVETRPDVAIVDIGLPELDGYDVARAVKQRTDGSCPFLIALTGYGQAEDRQAALDAGFDAHLTKPVDLRELESLLAQQAAGRTPAPHS
jgi:two-component system, chemotaxis family, CheB/CheR fusion protein